MEIALSKYGDLRWTNTSCDYLGVHYEQQPDFSIRADMTAMTKRILAKRQVTKGADFPSVHNLFEKFDDDGVDYSTNVSDFLSQVMEIHYLTKVRVDIAKETNYLSTLGKSPGPVAYKILHHLQAYLYRTVDHYVLFGTDDPTPNLYVDASFAPHSRDSKSHGGIYVTLGQHNGPIYIRSGKIKLVCMSICEAELYKIVDGVQHIYSVAKFLEEVGAIPILQFIVNEDNTASIIISWAGENRSTRSKSFRVRHHFLKQLLEDGTMVIKHCPSEDMIADYLPKGMVGEPFVRLTTIAMGRARKGSVKE